MGAESMAYFNRDGEALLSRATLRRKAPPRRKGNARCCMLRGRNKIQFASVQWGTLFPSWHSVPPTPELPASAKAPYGRRPKFSKAHFFCQVPKFNSPRLPTSRNRRSLSRSFFASSIAVTASWSWEYGQGEPIRRSRDFSRGSVGGYIVA